jgi:hypothetical protein
LDTLVVWQTWAAMAATAKPQARRILASLRTMRSPAASRAVIPLIWWAMGRFPLRAITSQRRRNLMALPAGAVSVRRSRAISRWKYPTQVELPGSVWAKPATAITPDFSSCPPTAKSTAPFRGELCSFHVPAVRIQYWRYLLPKHHFVRHV